MRYPLHQLIGWRDMVIAVGLDGAVKAFALGDGRLLWSSPGPELNDEKSAVWEERSMEERLPPPVVYKNNLFLGGDRVIRRLSLEDGNELKPFGFLEEEKERVLFTSPLVASDSALFFSTGLEKTFTGHFQAIDLESGQTMWTHKWGRSKNTILVVDKKLIIVGNRSAGMSRLPRSGLFMFEHELGVDLPTKISCKSTADKPVVHQGAFLLADRLRVVKMDVKSGRELWNYRSRKLFLPLLVVGGNVIYVTDSSGSVHAINASDGNSLWVCETKETPIPGKDIPLVPSNGALFRLTVRGIEVLGSPVAREQAPVVVGGKPSDPAAIREEIEGIDRQIGEFREEWQACKQLLAEPQASGGESEESMKKRETASRRIREIAEAVPQLKARRAELEKQLK
jgi:outer membrane protein assembly factor BamB